MRRPERAPSFARAPRTTSDRTLGPARRPRVLFLGKTYAGWQTRFLNLQSHMNADARIDPDYRAVTGWDPAGGLERLHPLPHALRGRLRATVQAAPFARFPRPDVIWSSAGEVLLPYLWTQASPANRPLVLELDWTLEQQESMAREYFGHAPRTGVPLALARWRERILWKATTAFVAMSNWAAESLVRQGVPAERVHVIHPGVDLEWWTPAGRTVHNRPIRLLFVGGDFDRKGGQELVDLVASRLAGRCELDLVTHAGVAPAPGIRAHKLGPNSPELRELYRAADLFVLPTRADCFGHAAVEAMACGTPVMMTDVGGARDIVAPGETGWLLDSSAALGAALEDALQSRERLHAMGDAARRRAETQFDGAANDRRLADLLLRLAQPAASRELRHASP
ncbi:MAG: glycosyltransferase family 4 protein [Tepidiformaceae bacterium]